MDHEKIGYFISKKGLKAQIPKFCIFGRYIEFVFFIQFWCSLFLWIDCDESFQWYEDWGTRASSGMRTEGRELPVVWGLSDESFQWYEDWFPLSLAVSEINLTKRGQQRPNSKIWTFLFISQFKYSFIYRFSFSCPWGMIFLHARELN